jgi:hypothetical protein
MREKTAGKGGIRGVVLDWGSHVNSLPISPINGCAK